MSFDVVRTWVNHMLRPGASRDGVLRLFERASTDGVEATVLAGSELTAMKKAFLVRWTGMELVVVELSAPQQVSLGLLPHALFTQLEARTLSELPPNLCVTLTDVRIDSADSYDGWQPLTGSCTCAFDEGETPTPRSCALRAEYFRPNLPRPVSAFWYVDAPLIAPRGELRFKFNPLFSKKNPATVSGTLVLFLQLLTAEDWRRQQGCRRISNVVSTIVELR